MSLNLLTVPLPKAREIARQVRQILLEDSPPAHYIKVPIKHVRVSEDNASVFQVLVVTEMNWTGTMKHHSFNWRFNLGGNPACIDRDTIAFYP